MISPAPQGARGPPLSSTQMRAGSKVTTPAGGRSSVWFEQRRSPTVVAERIGGLELRLNAIWSLGFAEAGLSLLRVAADGSELSAVDWPNYRDALIDVARCELERAMRGQPIRLTNFAVALKQIHAGAGGGYFSVAADRDRYACHRAVGDERYRLGSASTLDGNRGRLFLEARHVRAKADCRVCGARYLCSGGCNQEAPMRSVASCDFVRGWLRLRESAELTLSGQQRSRSNFLISSPR
jgi:uncharacterized protein